MKICKTIFHIRDW